MRIPTILSLLCAAAFVQAQPTITVNNIPQLGDITTIGICSDMVDENALSTSAGALQNWDFSGLTEASEEQFNFVDPATTLWPTDFPGSTLCGVSWEQAHSYYAVGPDALETVGQVLIVSGPTADTMKLNYSDNNERIIPIPYTYGDSFDDTFSGTFTTNTFFGTVDGTVDFEADGYGTLVLPNATYSNVVRYHISRVQRNTIFGNIATQTKEQWAWVSQDHRFWLLLMEINNDGFGVESLVWYDKDPASAGNTSVSELLSDAQMLFPNPVRAGQTVRIHLPKDQYFEHIRLIDAQGRLVLEEQVTSEPTLELPVAKGSYVLQLVGTRPEDRVFQRLIVE